MQESSNVRKLSFIDFITLDKWFVSYYINPHSIKSQFRLVKLKDLIKPIKDKIKLKEYNGDLRVVKKISFNDGQIHVRKENVTKMDLYILHPDDLLVSKINFHQGALAINKYEKIVCTTHYQPYSINRSLIIDEYLIIALRSKKFQGHLEFLRAEGIKNEATYEFIEELEIPLPELKEQEKILNLYQEKIKQANDLEKEVNDLELEIEKYLFRELSIELNKKILRNSFISEIRFQNLERWSVDFIKQNITLSFILNGKYEVVKLKDIIFKYQYGLSEKAVKENIGIPMLRMNNIYNSSLVVDNLKYILKTAEINKYLLKKGDLLFNRTNSKELVGKTAIFDLDGEFTFASYLIRVELKSEIADYHFINYLFNSSILQFQKDIVSRQITGQANINAQEMREFLFPLPPIEKQKEIVSSILSMKNNISLNILKSTRFKLEAEAEFEKEIFS